MQRKTIRTQRTTVDGHPLPEGKKERSVYAYQCIRGGVVVLSLVDAKVNPMCPMCEVRMIGVGPTAIRESRQHETVLR
jgi:hypothetical protein